MMIKHTPFELFGTPVLAGAQAGRRALAHWIEVTPRVSVPQPIYLDFSEIEAATASFLRECVFGFRDHCRRSSSPMYPVVANVAEAVEDELTFFAEEVGDAIWCCDLTEDGHVSNTRLIGQSRLDAGQQLALKHISEKGETSAPSIAKNVDASVGPTAWNNRLAALSAKGLVVETRNGKTKLFRSIWRSA